MIRNVHQRRVRSHATAVGRLLDALSSSCDQIWPNDAWPPLLLDGPLGVGAQGGHGTIRYSVESYTPGQEVVFRFDPVGGLTGTHTFSVRHTGEDTLVSHVLEAKPTAAMRLLWPLVLRWLHDALIEDAFDNVEAVAAGQLPPPRRHGPVVRFLRSTVRPRPLDCAGVVAVDVTACALTAIAALHAAWGLGMTWPGTDARSLAQKVVGGSVFPSPTACFVVAGLVTAAAALVAARAHPKAQPLQRIPQPLAVLGVTAVAAVLGLRGAMGMVGSATGLLASTGEFRRLNLAIYSPLCLALAAGTLKAR